MSMYGPRSRTRDVILSETRSLLRFRPMNSLSMEDVARAAGISRRTIYNQFDGFEALFRTCFEQLVAELSRSVQTDIPPSADPEAGLALLGVHAARLFSDERYADLARQILRVGDAHDWLDEACQRQIKAPLVIAIENQLLRHRRVFGTVDTRAPATRYLTMIEGLSVWPTLLAAPRIDMPRVDEMQIRDLTQVFVASYRRRRMPRPPRATYAPAPAMQRH